MAHRKFNTKSKRHDKEARRKKRTQVTISIIFVALMVFSIAGIYVSNQQNQSLSGFSYNGYEFEVQQDSIGQFFLETYQDDQQLVFYSLPQDTFRIPVQGNITSVINDVPYLALAANPTPELAQIIDLMRFDFDRYGGVLVAGVPFGTNTTSISCLNATPQVPVITLQEGNITQIDVQGSCVQVEARVPDLFLIRDRLLYSITSIVER